LDAEVTIYSEHQDYIDEFSRLGDELRFVFITSGAKVERGRHPNAVPSELNPTEIAIILVTQSPHPKCIRCWHHRADVGRNDKHPQICARCIENVAGAGESREYA
jgi:isoleucyl-tRNA synthetase